MHLGAEIQHKQRGWVSSFRRVFRLRPAHPGIPGSNQGWGRIFSGHAIQTALGPTALYSTVTGCQW